MRTRCALAAAGLGALTCRAGRGAFYAFGELKAVKVRPAQRCAFVEYTTREAAEQAASSLHGKLLLKVRAAATPGNAAPAHPRARRAPSCDSRGPPSPSTALPAAAVVPWRPRGRPAPPHPCPCLLACAPARRCRPCRSCPAHRRCPPLPSRRHRRHRAPRRRRSCKSRRSGRTIRPWTPRRWARASSREAVQMQLLLAPPRSSSSSMHVRVLSAYVFVCT